MSAPHRREQPVDLAAVARDDALLSAVAAGTTPDVAPGDEELVVVMQGWRRQIHRDPIPELVDVETAQEVLRTGRHRKHGKRRAPRVSRKWWRQFLRRLLTR